MCSIGVVNESLFMMFFGSLPNDSKHIEASFFADFDRFLVLMSRSCRDLAIFVVTQDNNDNDSRSLCPLYICTWSNYTAVQWFTLIRCLAHDVTL